MKAPIFFGIKFVFISVSIGLALAFYATRPDRLPPIPDLFTSNKTFP